MADAQSTPVADAAEVQLSPAPTASLVASEAFSSATDSASAVEPRKWHFENAKKGPGGEDHGSAASGYVKSLVFGGLDGAITTISSISAIVGGSLSMEVVLVLGFSNLIADAISMGMGDFVSSTAEFNHQVAERKREAWEMENYPEGERQEMVEHLMSKGFEKEDAEGIISIIGQDKHKDFFVDYMMVEELGLEIPDDPWGPAKDGGVTLLSFIVFGSVPMWVYLIAFGANYTDRLGVFGIACGFTALSLFLLGWVQGVFSRQSKLKSGLVILVNGALATAAAYGVGYGIGKAVGSDC